LCLAKQRKIWLESWLRYSDLQEVEQTLLDHANAVGFMDPEQVPSSPFDTVRMQGFRFRDQPIAQATLDVHKTALQAAQRDSPGILQHLEDEDLEQAEPAMEAVLDTTKEAVLQMYIKLTSMKTICMSL
jgi:hypothetical protein